MKKRIVLEQLHRYAIEDITPYSDTEQPLSARTIQCKFCLKSGYYLASAYSGGIIEHDATCLYITLRKSLERSEA